MPTENEKLIQKMVLEELRKVAAKMIAESSMDKENKNEESEFSARLLYNCTQDRINEIEESKDI